LDKLTAELMQDACRYVKMNMQSKKKLVVHLSKIETMYSRVPLQKNDDRWSRLVNAHDKSTYYSRRQWLPPQKKLEELSHSRFVFRELNTRLLEQVLTEI
jgi:hypothetical protein